MDLFTVKSVGGFPAGGKHFTSSAVGIVVATAGRVDEVLVNARSSGYDAGVLNIHGKIQVTLVEGAVGVVLINSVDTIVSSSYCKPVARFIGAASFFFFLMALEPRYPLFSLTVR